MSSDGQRAKISLNYKGRPSFTWAFFWPTRTREYQRQLTPTILSLWKIHQGVEYFELNRSRLESLPVSRILKMKLTLRYFLFLTQRLASNQLHASSSNWCQGSRSKGRLRVLTKSNFDTVSVTWRSKFSAVTVMCKCTTITLLDDSELIAFQTLWPRFEFFVW